MDKLLGKKPNQAPRNADLGSMAYQDHRAVNIKGGKATLQSAIVESLSAQSFGADKVTSGTGEAIASAATVNLDTATGNRVHITGTTTITAIILSSGPVTVIFDGVLTLTHHATNNNLPGAANIVTAVGDRAVYESDGTTVYCVSYTRNNSYRSMLRTDVSSNAILTVSDSGGMTNVTSGTFTQTLSPCASLGNGWSRLYKNEGTGTVTIDPDGAETINDLTTLIVYPGDFYLLTCNGASLKAQIIAGERELIIQDQKTAGVDGGNSGAVTWNIRTLNTVVKNTIQGASLASNEITLPAGNYSVFATAPARWVDGHRARLYNITAASTILEGGNQYSSSTLEDATNNSIIVGAFSLSATSSLRLEHYTQKGTTNGLGQNINALVEVYSQIHIRRVS